MNLRTTEARSIEVDMIALELAIDLLETTMNKLEYSTPYTY